MSDKLNDALVCLLKGVILLQDIKGAETEVMFINSVVERLESKDQSGELVER